MMKRLMVSDEVRNGEFQRLTMMVKGDDYHTHNRIIFLSGRKGKNVSVKKK